MMSSDDPYRALGVSPDATDAEIKRAYRRLARQHHPDRNPGDAAAEERFKAIQAAQEAIGTPESRREHDEQKQMHEMFGGIGGDGIRFDFGGGGGLEDLVRQMMGGGDSFRGAGGGTIFDRHGRPKSTSGFGPMGGASGHGRGAAGPTDATDQTRGRDLQLPLDIDLEMASVGGDVPFRLSRLRRCRSCEGSVFGTGRRCASCDGLGVERRSSSVTVRIPARVEHGHLLRLRKLGDEHPVGKSGDLTLEVRIDAGEGRRWEDGRLVQTVEVPYSTLLLGGRVRIVTPKGVTVDLEIGEGSRIGDRRRLGGQGVDGGPLDVEFTLSEPDEISDEQRSAIEGLRDSGL